MTFFFFLSRRYSKKTINKVSSRGGATPPTPVKSRDKPQTQAKKNNKKLQGWKAKIKNLKKNDLTFWPTKKAESDC